MKLYKVTANISSAIITIIMAMINVIWKIIIYSLSTVTKAYNLMNRKVYRNV